MRLSCLRSICLLCLIWVWPAFGQTFTLPLRLRVEAFRASDAWHEARVKQPLQVKETAIVICDMWDSHWCSGAVKRVNEMVERMAAVADEARSRGIQIVHAPSDTMEFYKDYPQRRRMQAVAPAQPPFTLALPEPALPISPGCDTPGETSAIVWKRQHPAIRIAPEDGVSADGAEIYSFFRQQGIANMIIMGVHTNVCILNRKFAIKQMTKWGIRCVLVRDLTDTMYDPKTAPYVSHERGTDLVIEHIEKHWCPTTLSAELVEALRAGE